MQMRTWSSRQDHTQTALSGLTSPGTCLGESSGWLRQAPHGSTSWRGESLHSVCEWIQIHNIIQYASKFSITKMNAVSTLQHDGGGLLCLPHEGGSRFPYDLG